MEKTGNMTDSIVGGDVTGKVARTVDQATSSMHKVIDKASDAAKPTVDRVSSAAHSAVDKLGGAALTAAETLDTRGTQLKNAQQRMVDSCGEYVRENPITALGIAVAAGFLLSRLMSSR